MNIVHILLKIIIPFLSGFLYRAGGADQTPWLPICQKWVRWLMGIPVGFLFTIGIVPWNIVAITTVLCGITYYIATAAFKYGEKSWLNFLGEYGKFTVCGLAFGLAAIPAIGIVAGIIQGIVSAIGFLTIKILDDKNIVKNPWVERLRGFFGTIISILK
jgi:hypothetical protein